MKIRRESRECQHHCKAECSDDHLISHSLMINATIALPRLVLDEHAIAGSNDVLESMISVCLDAMSNA
jgi:hypothetical protein